MIDTAKEWRAFAEQYCGVIGPSRRTACDAILALLDEVERLTTENKLLAGYHGEGNCHDAVVCKEQCDALKAENARLGDENMNLRQENASLAMLDGKEADALRTKLGRAREALSAIAEQSCESVDGEYHGVTARAALKETE